MGPGEEFFRVQGTGLDGELEIIAKRGISEDHGVPWLTLHDTAHHDRWGMNLDTWVRVAHAIIALDMQRRIEEEF